MHRRVSEEAAQPEEITNIQPWPSNFNSGELQYKDQ